MDSDAKIMIKKVIIITGAAGGLGQAIVRTCLSNFPDLIIVATDITPKVESMFAGEVIAKVMDVTDEASIHAVRKSLEKNDIQVWGMVNNAGVSDFFPVSEKEKASLEKMFAINTFGAVNMVRPFFPT